MGVGEEAQNKIVVRAMLWQSHCRHYVKSRGVPKTFVCRSLFFHNSASETNRLFLCLPRSGGLLDKFYLETDFSNCPVSRSSRANPREGGYCHVMDQLISSAL